jgi:hypothetical protein
MTKTWPCKVLRDGLQLAPGLTDIDGKSTYAISSLYYIIVFYPIAPFPPYSVAIASDLHGHRIIIHIAVLGAHNCFSHHVISMMGVGNYTYVIYAIAWKPGEARIICPPHVPAQSFCERLSIAY